jgi:hypothetical protein
MVTTVQEITSDEDLQTFVECYDREIGHQAQVLDFVKNATVYLFRDQDGTPVGGYTINTEQAFRTLSYLPASLAADLRARAAGLDTYELGTIWVSSELRHSRTKLEVWLHIFENMVARAGIIMVGGTISDEIYSFYSRYGMKLLHHNSITLPDGTSAQQYFIYCDDIYATKIPEMAALLRRRLERE